eukprot:3957402-Pleurochrysis_carterae.AAC.1
MLNEGTRVVVPRACAKKYVRREKARWRFAGEFEVVRRTGVTTALASGCKRLKKWSSEGEHGSRGGKRRREEKSAA